MKAKVEMWEEVGEDTLQGGLLGAREDGECGRDGGDKWRKGLS